VANGRLNKTFALEQSKSFYHKRKKNVGAYQQSVGRGGRNTKRKGAPGSEDEEKTRFGKDRRVVNPSTGEGALGKKGVWVTRRLEQYSEKRTAEDRTNPDENFIGTAGG